jgi:peptidoglycan hydrolase-like protein with peptidoglycan-binding domain
MLPLRLLATAIALALLVAGPAAAAKPKPNPRVSWVRCQDGCSSGKVLRGGSVKLGGRGFESGARVVFLTRDGGTRSMRAELRGSTRLIANVPGNARSGRIYVRARGGVRSNNAKVQIAPPPPDQGHTSTAGTAFDGGGMWIWKLNEAEGGDPSAIATRALANNVRTIFVKSGDGTTYWQQFTPQLVQALKGRGIEVCAWQYVYGTDPEGEAAVAALAKQAGAACFVIDAESEFEGKYEQAQRYVNNLRAAVGPDYPIGLTSFAFVDVHPGFPYSVFLGPGGAQFNLPQVYWHAIGGGVDAVVNHTYEVNRPYGRPIAPIGQTYHDPPLPEIQRFRQLVAANRSGGVSWWAWHETNDAEWASIGAPLGPAADPQPSQAFVTVKRGNKGDLVRWAQLHLTSAGFGTNVDGDFGPGTQAQVTAFQQSRGLPATGEVDSVTWLELLKAVPPTGKKAPRTAKLRPTRNELKTAPRR